MRRNMQIVFQDAVGSLDPRMTVKELVGEGLRIHGIDRKGRERAVLDVLERVGLSAEAAGALSAPVQRRPAPAHRPRPRTRAAAEVHRRRRARVGPRRLDPVAGAEPARRAEARVQPDLPLRRPRPRRRRLHLGPRRGHVPRQDRRARDVGGSLPAAAPPLHDGAPVGEPGADPGPQAPADRARGRRAEPDRPALRLPLPHALPDRAGDLRRGRAAARGSRPGPRRGVPLRREADHRRPPRSWGDAAGGPAAARPAGADAGRHLALRGRLPSALRRPAPDRLPVDAVRVDARPLRRLGRLVRSARLRRRRHGRARPVRVGGRVRGLEQGRRRRPRLPHLGGRRGLVQRPHRHLGPELRRTRPVAAHPRGTPEPRLRRPAGDPRRLLLGRLLDGRRLPARAHARRGGDLDERDLARHRPERARPAAERPHLAPPAADRARRGRDRPPRRLLARVVGAPGERRLLAPVSPPAGGRHDADLPAGGLVRPLLRLASAHVRGDRLARAEPRPHGPVVARGRRRDVPRRRRALCRA